MGAAAGWGTHVWSARSRYCPVGHGAELAGDAQPTAAVAIAAAMKVARNSMCAGPFSRCDS